MNLKFKDQWTIEEKNINKEFLAEHESIFSLSNGTIGIRGFYEESFSLSSEDSVYMNGFHDTEPYTYGEIAYGYAKNKQKMIALPSMSYCDIVVDDEKLDLSTAKYSEYKRQLHLDNGTVTREYIWETTSGVKVSIVIEKLVSLIERRLIATEYRILADKECRIQIVSYSKKDNTNDFIETDDPRVGGLNKRKSLHLLTEAVMLDNKGCAFLHETDSSKLKLYTGVVHSVNIDNAIIENEVTESETKTIIEVIANSEPIVINKNVYYSDEEESFEGFIDFIENSKVNFKELKAKQKEMFDAFWAQQSISIYGDDDVLAALRFNVFSLYQHVGKDGRRNICAKGLSGEGYEGHYFWDTEVYVLPVFTYTNPAIARKLLESRYRMLPKSKERAAELSYEGALYAWRTINGEEASAYYPAGTAQIHINADIAYAVYNYYNATLDNEFMEAMGLEMLAEIAKFFGSYVDFIPEKGYVINGVTGPDEYTALVNNNIYTNLMVKKLFSNIAKLTEKFSFEKFGVTEETLKFWKDIEEKIYIHKENGLYAQDELFFHRKEWDFAKRPLRPLLLHYHPMMIYKHKVLKQADIVLSTLTCHEFFNKQEVEDIYNYYEPLTTHDSTLSETIHGIVAAQIGKVDLAYKYFENTVKTDLFNLHNNVNAGLHMAAMSGGWQGLINGFGGVRILDNKISINPVLPEKWNRYEFAFYFRGVKIDVAVEKNEFNVTTDKNPADFGFEIVSK